MPGTPHRKRIRHCDKGGEPRCLTFSCYRRLRLLEDPWRLEELGRSIDRAASRHGWSLAAFVFMPEHVQVLVYPQSAGLRVSELLHAIKKPCSYRIKLRMIEENNPLSPQLTVRQRPGRSAFRFWQEGPGHDRNLTTQDSVLATTDYLHLNPVRRGLTERAQDYCWSSARWYVEDGRHNDPALPRLSALPPDFLVDLGIVSG